MLKTIRLTPEDVKHFVDVASKCDFDIDICYNRYVIDAKSFLGVYGLDFTKPLTVSYDGYNDKFEEMLSSVRLHVNALTGQYFSTTECHLTTQVR